MFELIDSQEVSIQVIIFLPLWEVLKWGESKRTKVCFRKWRFFFFSSLLLKIAKSDWLTPIIFTTYNRSMFKKKNANKINLDSRTCTTVASHFASALDGVGGCTKVRVTYSKAALGLWRILYCVLFYFTHGDYDDGRSHPPAPAWAAARWAQISACSNWITVAGCREKLASANWWVDWKN